MNASKPNSIKALHTALKLRCLVRASTSMFLLNSGPGLTMVLIP